MEFGVTFPQTDIEPHPDDLRRFAIALEEIGFEHLLAYDHILGVEPPHAEWGGAYDYTDQFLEPFVLFSHLASVTADLDFITGILVLPQRETVLVAKQAATLDVLSGGRFSLGAGVGWNEREYRNLGMAFENRGKRIDEQIDLLGELWGTELVDFEGEWHEIQRAGINPRPNDGSIPLWLGGSAEIVIERMARKADGWIAPTLPIPTFEEKIQTLHDSLDEAGRDPESFPIHARVHLGSADGDDWIERIEAYQTLGVTHVGIGTMNMGLTAGHEHLSIFTEAMNELEERGIV